MDFKSLLSQLTNLSSNIQKTSEPPQDTPPCFYPEQFNSTDQQQNQINYQQNSNSYNSTDNQNTALLGGLLNNQNNLPLLLGLFSLISGNKGGINSLISNIASTSPEFSKYAPLIQILTKSENKNTNTENKLPNIDSLKRIE